VEPLLHTYSNYLYGKVQPLLHVYSINITYFCVTLKLKLGFEFFKMPLRYHTDLSVWITTCFADEAILTILRDPRSPHSYTVSWTLGWWALNSQQACTYSLVLSQWFCMQKPLWNSCSRYILLWSSSSFWSSHSLIQPAVRLRTQDEKITEFMCTHP